MGIGVETANALIRKTPTLALEVARLLSALSAKAGEKLEGEERLAAEADHRLLDAGQSMQYFTMETIKKVQSVKFWLLPKLNPAERSLPLQDAAARTLNADIVKLDT